jgi:hypothetical protein
MRATGIYAAILTIVATVFPASAGPVDPGQIRLLIREVDAAAGHVSLLPGHSGPGLAARVVTRKGQPIELTADLSPDRDFVIVSARAPVDAAHRPPAGTRALLELQSGLSPVILSLGPDGYQARSYILNRDIDAPLLREALEVTAEAAARMAEYLEGSW